MSADHINCFVSIRYEAARFNVSSCEVYPALLVYSMSNDRVAVASPTFIVVHFTAENKGENTYNHCSVCFHR